MPQRRGCDHRGGSEGLQGDRDHLRGKGRSRLDTDQGEQLSRTYTTLAGNPNVAQEALEALDLGLTRQELLDKMSFTPVERTQLLEIGAEDRPRRRRN